MGDDEVYQDTDRKNIKNVIAAFGTTTDALLDVITSKFKPTGKIPFSTPVSKTAVQNQKTDVPSYREGPRYDPFNYNEGLMYQLDY